MAALLVAISFLNPVVAGPSPIVWQLLATGGCLALLFGTGDASSSSPGKRRVGFLAWGIVISATVNAVLALMQFNGATGMLDAWLISPGQGRAWGTLRQRNQFATLISLGLIAVLWLYATAGARFARPWFIAAIVLLMAGAAASGSRTGVLQLALISAVAGFAAWRQRSRKPNHSSMGRCLPPPLALLALLPLYFAFSWLLPYLAVAGKGKAVASAGALFERLQPAALGNESRLTLWHNVLSLIAERPLTGWGWGELSYAHFMAVYPGPRFPVLLDNAHNLPLHLAVELGIPAAVLICGGFLWLVISARPWRERDPNRLMAWGLVGVILVHSLLEYPLWYGPFQLVFGLCLGMLWPARQTEESSPRSRKRWLPDRRRFQAFASIALLSFVVYAAWDYTRISQVYLPRDERLPPWQDDTLAKVRDSWLFARQVDFAELTLTPVTHENVARMHALAERTLHFSPEPRVIVKLIESAELSGHDDEARLIAERFRVAFPRDYARWLRQTPGEAPPAP
ncbi:O-antigen ligase C-terminal domain-containing protein [Variovorax paradoxus]|nr:O-antigen ligase C-terminal domain-containing protein [Variovorax paradoxus]